MNMNATTYLGMNVSPVNARRSLSVTYRDRTQSCGSRVGGGESKRRMFIYQCEMVEMVAYLTRWQYFYFYFISKVSNLPLDKSNAACNLLYFFN